jgi:hypothetical protein
VSHLGVIGVFILDFEFWGGVEKDRTDRLRNVWGRVIEKEVSRGSTGDYHGITVSLWGMNQTGIGELTGAD